MVDRCGRPIEHTKSRLPIHSLNPTSLLPSILPVYSFNTGYHPYDKKSIGLNIHRIWRAGVGAFSPRSHYIVYNCNVVRNTKLQVMHITTHCDKHIQHTYAYKHTHSVCVCVCVSVFVCLCSLKSIYYARITIWTIRLH